MALASTMTSLTLFTGRPRYSDQHCAERLRSAALMVRFTGCHSTGVRSPQAHRHDNTSSGLDHVLRILGRTLDASQDELGGLFVGDLVIHLLRKAGDAILPVLPSLLSALLHRLPTAATASFLQVRTLVQSEVILEEDVRTESHPSLRLPHLHATRYCPLATRADVGQR